VTKTATATTTATATRREAGSPASSMDGSVQQGISGLAVRSGIGGVLMGLANLVPGISGGTMLLAAGVYPDFIGAIADITRFRFKKRSIVTLAAVVACAGMAVLLLAGVVKDLVVDHRWVMYSLFIGLTLGGLPLVWRMAKPATKSTWIGACFGFVGMALLALAQQAGSSGESAGPPGAVFMFVAGVAGASAMILPGVSGGYLLLVLGAYVPLLAGIHSFKNGLKAQDMGVLMEVGMQVILPVGLGVVIGVAVVSNLLNWCLDRYRNATLGVLLGLLLGAVIGLWPFQQGVQPKVGEIFRGQVVTAESQLEIKPEKYPTDFFKPEASHVGGACVLIILGFLCTIGIAKFGERKDEIKSGAKQEH
jgi:putative membrane protein